MASDEGVTPFSTAMKPSEGLPYRQDSQFPQSNAGPKVQVKQEDTTSEEYLSYFLPSNEDDVTKRETDDGIECKEIKQETMNQDCEQIENKMKAIQSEMQHLETKPDSKDSLHTERICNFDSQVSSHSTVAAWPLKMELREVEHNNGISFENNPQENRKAHSKKTAKRDGNAKLFKCKYCDYKSNWKNTLKKHIGRIHDKNAKIYQCMHCDYKVKCKIYLAKHVKYKHDDSADVYECESCNYKSKRKDELARHMKRKHDDNAVLHECTYCEYKAKLKSDLTQHVKYRHVDSTKMYECKQCDFKTKRNYNLTAHVKYKHNDSAEVYECKQCDFKSKHKSNLTGHVKNMHNVMHKCMYCDYTAKQQSNLNQHVKNKHVGSNEAYEYDSYSLLDGKQEGLLAKSVKDTHDDEIYRCNFCEYVTRYMNDLIIHVASKHDDVTEMFEHKLVKEEPNFQ